MEHLDATKRRDVVSPPLALLLRSFPTAPDLPTRAGGSVAGDSKPGVGQSTQVPLGSAGAPWRR